MPNATAAPSGNPSIAAFTKSLNGQAPSAAPGGLDRPTIANFLSEWASGVGSVPQGAGPIGAFASGLGGALKAEKDRDTTEAATKIAAEDREREFGFKTREEERAVAKDKREAEKEKLDNLKTAAEIQTEIRKNEGKLNPQQMISLNQLVFREVKSMRDSGQFTEDEIQSRALALRRQISADMVAGTLQDEEGNVDEGAADDAASDVPTKEETQPAVRPRARNQKTGEIVEWDGKQWVPVKK